MRFRESLIAGMLIALSRVATATAAPVELELVTERGVQITAPQEWLQLLAGIGIDQVRIRGGQPGDEPQIVNPVSSGGSYHVVGVLTSRDQLRRLPSLGADWFMPVISKRNYACSHRCQ